MSEALPGPARATELPAGSALKRARAPADERRGTVPVPEGSIVHTAGLLLAIACAVAPSAWAGSRQEAERLRREESPLFGWLHEARIGVLAHDVDGLWSGTRAEGGVDVNAELVFAPSWRLRFGSLRPNLGASVNTQGDTSKLYAGLLWELRSRSGWFLELGVGAALHNGKRRTNDDDRKKLGTRVLFRIPIEVGVTLGERHRISILFDHVSNASFADENEGLDTLGLRYGLSF